MTRGMAISSLVIRFLWWGLGLVFVVYVYVKVLQERNKPNSDEFFFCLHNYCIGLLCRCSRHLCTFSQTSSMPCSVRSFFLPVFQVDISGTMLRWAWPLREIKRLLQVCGVLVDCPGRQVFVQLLC